VCMLPAVVLLHCSQAGSALLISLYACCLQMSCCTVHRQVLHSSSHCVHSACRCPAEMSTGSFCTPHLIVCILPADILLHCSQAGSALLMSLCAFCLQLSCCTVHRQGLHSSSHPGMWSCCTSLQGSLIHRMPLATSSSSQHVKLTFQCTSKPTFVSQHKLVAVVWRLHCKCVVSAVACVQSVVRSVITVAAISGTYLAHHELESNLISIIYQCSLQCVQCHLSFQAYIFFHFFSPIFSFFFFHTF